MPRIHPTAQVDPRAEIEEGVVIGPYCVIGPEVRIGKNTILKSHCVIAGPTIIGERNEIGPFVTLGEAPQHLAYRNEPTRLVIGDENVIREYVSVHRGTMLDQGETKIGNRCYLMAYTHVGHDCILEDEVILTNATHLGGHVRVGSGAVFGGGAFVHQFCRIGELAFISGMTGVDKDVPPFFRVFGIPARIAGLNLVGLKRRGFSSEDLRQLSKALKIYLQEATLDEVIREIRTRLGEEGPLAALLSFLEAPSRRGCVRKKLT